MADAIKIEDSRKKLMRLSDLLEEYRLYIRARENQPLAAEIIERVASWVRDNVSELETK